MPYEKIIDLPASIRHSLPEHAQDIFWRFTIVPILNNRTQRKDAVGKAWNK
jgi:cation transport regulator ChaB